MYKVENPVFSRLGFALIFYKCPLNRCPFLFAPAPLRFTLILTPCDGVIFNKTAVLNYQRFSREKFGVHMDRSRVYIQNDVHYLLFLYYWNRLCVALTVFYCNDVTKTFTSPPA